MTYISSSLAVETGRRRTVKTDRSSFARQRATKAHRQNRQKSTSSCGRSRACAERSYSWPASPQPLSSDARVSARELPSASARRATSNSRSASLAGRIGRRGSSRISHVRASAKERAPMSRRVLASALWSARGNARSLDQDARPGASIDRVGARAQAPEAPTALRTSTLWLPKRGTYRQSATLPQFEFSNPKIHANRSARGAGTHPFEQGVSCG